ncbi:MAG: hypothetical protein JXR51_07550 [Bacteroidales bacterium]|nr:hypothetical protein [Bacteroidales bacterium]MBN2757018.1 hypothetical protein [Bacteroidales bacterium]
MEKKHLIEKYLEGDLKGINLKIIEIKLRSNKKFQKRINIYKEIDKIMRVHLMVSDAEIEMKEKKLDILASNFIADWFSSNNEDKSIEKFLKFSLS